MFCGSVVFVCGWVLKALRFARGHHDHDDQLKAPFDLIRAEQLGHGQ